MVQEPRIFSENLSKASTESVQKPIKHEQDLEKSEQEKKHGADQIDVTSKHSQSFVAQTQLKAETPILTSRIEKEER